jgi:hypothetical protein
MSRRLALLALLACLAAAWAGAAADTAGGALPPQAGGGQHRPDDPAKTTAEEEAANEALDQDTPDEGSAGFIGQPAASCDAAATSAGAPLVPGDCGWQCAMLFTTVISLAQVAASDAIPLHALLLQAKSRGEALRGSCCRGRQPSTCLIQQ